MRRMVVQKIERLRDYVVLLQQNPVEVDALFHDLLINVTAFFRDPLLFQTLKKKMQKWMNFDSKFSNYNDNSLNLRLLLKVVDNMLPILLLKVMRRTLTLFIAVPVMIQVMNLIRHKDSKETIIAIRSPM